MKPERSHTVAKLRAELAEARVEIERLEAIVASFRDGIRSSDAWADDWCPVCQEHPSHDHGGKPCPMKTAEKGESDALRSRLTAWTTGVAAFLAACYVIVRWVIWLMFQDYD